MWPWVIQIFSSVSPWSARIASRRGTSPPGSITAAFLVFTHQTMVQFCCSGVTGATMARIGGPAAGGSWVFSMRFKDSEAAPEAQSGCGAIAATPRIAARPSPG